MKWQDLPDAPGVYIFKDKKGKVLYVGKARSLRKRVASYFTKELPPKVKRLMEKVADMDYLLTKSEVEALIVEANLIKFHKPKYNIRLKDDKKYPYIKVAINEPFPYVIPTRDLRDKHSIYFGPYTNAKTMRRALRTAVKIFKVRTCRGKLPDKACLSYYIGKCYAPCEGKISESEYRKLVEQLIAFLSGKSTYVEQQLEAEMNQLAAELKFEEAARVRDRLRAVRDIVNKQRAIFSTPIDMDVIGISQSGHTACIELLRIREGRLLGGEHYFMETLRESTAEVIRAFMLQYYKTAYFVPDEIVVPCVNEVDALAEWLSEKKGHRVEIKIPDRGTRRELLEMATENAITHMEESKSQVKVRPSISDLQRTLGLAQPPRRIEAFDISNIHGKYAVGSCVVFVDGKPDKRNYRRFRIRTVQGIDDYAMMEEVVKRRVARLQKENKKFPDLVLIDGGVGHVRVARKVYPPEVPVFGLAKRFEQIITPEGKILSVPLSSPALRLLQRIRNEAHRFAIEYHRKLREKPESILDAIPGVGAKRRQALIKYFGSLERLKRASIDEIAKVPGIGRKYAERIYEFLRSA